MKNNLTKCKNVSLLEHNINIEKHLLQQYLRYSKESPFIITYLLNILINTIQPPRKIGWKKGAYQERWFFEV
jgi:hypothetical protein